MDKLERARELGILKDGWRYIDYALDAAAKYGWICTCRWGEKGTGKSASMLQSGYSAFHGFDEYEEDKQGFKRGIIRVWDDMDAWKTTLAHTVFRPADFSKLLSQVLKEKRRLSWVGWDDINIHFPRSMYSTNRKVWERFSSNWEGFRANLSIFECTAPRKDKIVSFILSDMNWDILISGREKIETTRWFWDKDYYEPEKVNKFRLDIDDDPLIIDRIPKEVWNEYWSRKILLIDENTDGFRTMLDELDKPVVKRKAEAACPICGRDMGNEYNLRMHLSKHNKEKSEAIKIPAPS